MSIIITNATITNMLQVTLHSQDAKHVGDVNDKTATTVVINLADCSMPMSHQMGMQHTSAITMNAFETIYYGY